jgi:hypothetical protein
MAFVCLALVLAERQLHGHGDSLTSSFGSIRTGDSRNGRDCGPPNNIVDSRTLSVIDYLHRLSHMEIRRLYISEASLLNGKDFAAIRAIATLTRQL